MKKLVHVAFLFVVELIALVYAQAPISVYGALAELHGKAKQEGTTTSKQFFISYALQNLFSADFNTDDGFGTSKSLKTKASELIPALGFQTQISGLRQRNLLQIRLPPLSSTRAEIFL